MTRDSVKKLGRRRRLREDGDIWVMVREIRVEEMGKGLFAPPRACRPKLSPHVVPLHTTA
jgi:hypothetical protein